MDIAPIRGVENPIALHLDLILAYLGIPPGWSDKTACLGVESSRVPITSLRSLNRACWQASYHISVCSAVVFRRPREALLSPSRCGSVTTYPADSFRILSNFERVALDLQDAGLQPFKDLTRELYVTSLKLPGADYKLPLSLQSLTITVGNDCSQLDCSQLLNLHSLCISRWSANRDILAHRLPPSLESLDIEQLTNNCPTLDLSKLSHLRSISIHITEKSQVMPRLRVCCEITTLRLGSCDIGDLDFSRLIHLRVIDLLDCLPISHFTQHFKTTTLVNKITIGFSKHWHRGPCLTRDTADPEFDFSAFSELNYLHIDLHYLHLGQHPMVIIPKSLSQLSTDDCDLYDNDPISFSRLSHLSFSSCGPLRLPMTVSKFDLSHCAKLKHLSLDCDSIIAHDVPVPSCLSILLPPSLESGYIHTSRPGPMIRFSGADNLRWLRLGGRCVARGVKIPHDLKQFQNLSIRHSPVDKAYIGSPFPDHIKILFLNHVTFGCPPRWPRELKDLEVNDAEQLDELQNLPPGLRYVVVKCQGPTVVDLRGVNALERIDIGYSNQGGISNLIEPDGHTKRLVYLPSDLSSLHEIQLSGVAMHRADYIRLVHHRPNRCHYSMVVLNDDDTTDFIDSIDSMYEPSPLNG